MGFLAKKDGDIAKNIKMGEIQKGNSLSLGHYICPEGTPVNFAISGNGGAFLSERYMPFYLYFESFLGLFPIIVLHNHNNLMEEIAYLTWKEKCENCAENARPLICAVNEKNEVYQPFYGMNNMQIVSAFRQIAKDLGYSITPKFEKIIRAHIEILEILRQPVNLSGFYYLTSFNNMEEFYNNIMLLPCGENNAKRIWADISSNGDDENNQLDLFRAVVNNLAEEAETNGWKRESKSSINCTEAIRNNATLLLSINGYYTNYFFTYLVEELKSAKKPFLIVIDGINIHNRYLYDYLKNNNNFIIGLVSDNVVDMLGEKEEDFVRFAEKINSFILFKHGTGKNAVVLSEMIGRCDIVRAEETSGSNKAFFSFLPSGTHKDVHYSKENRYRIMPEEITNLKNGEAIIFNTVTNNIYRFNQGGY